MRARTMRLTYPRAPKPQSQTHQPVRMCLSAQQPHISFEEQNRKACFGSFWQTSGAIPVLPSNKQPNASNIHQFVSYHHNHKLPPGTGLMPAFRISFFLASISSLNFTCSKIFPSRAFLSASAAASQTVQQSACITSSRLCKHTCLVRLRILLQFAHEIGKVLLLCSPIFQTPLLQVGIVLQEELFFGG
jgi:hypothetical protein